MKMIRQKESVYCDECSSCLYEGTIGFILTLGKEPYPVKAALCLHHMELLMRNLSKSLEIICKH